MSKDNKAIIQISDEDNLTSNLHRLLQEKRISETELSRQTNIPQPTLNRILSGKTEDPRASTLKALATFFDVSIDDLLIGAATTQSIQSKPSAQAVPIISWEECINYETHTKELTTTNWDQWIVCQQTAQNAYALRSKPSMEPRFPRGTVLLIDPNISPEDGDIIVAQYPNAQETTLREILIDGPIIQLLSINQSSSTEKFITDIKILGVVTKSIFSYN